MTPAPVTVTAAEPGRDDLREQIAAALDVTGGCAHSTADAWWTCDDCLADAAMVPVQAHLDRAEDEECTHESWSGAEGPVALLPGVVVVRWECDGCGRLRYDDDALNVLREQLRAALAPEPTP